MFLRHGGLGSEFAAAQHVGAAALLGRVVTMQSVQGAH